MLFTEGTTQTTITGQKNLMARATIAENFEHEFAVFDLSRFLGVLSLFSDPDLQLGENKVVIQEGKQKVEYAYADRDMIVVPPSKTPSVPQYEVTFRLTSEMLKSTLSAMGVLSATHFMIEGDGENVTIGAGKPKDPTSDTFRIEVGVSNHAFKIAIKAEHMKVLQDDYDVSISSRKIVHMACSDVEYWIMADTEHSTFN
jgi:hypothetical protein